MADSEGIKHSGRNVFGDSAFGSVSLVEACKEGLYILWQLSKLCHSINDLSKKGDKKESLSACGDDEDDEGENDHNFAHLDGSYTSENEQPTRRNCLLYS